MMTFFALKAKNLDYLYRPRVFLRIPHLLINNGLESLRCPRTDCNKKLETKGYNKKPHARRIVNLFSCFYLMSMRYRFSSSKCGASFNAHDSENVEQLPFELQVEFPAVLSYRGGISKKVADLLRPCLQKSVGPERFQKILRELHVLQNGRIGLHSPLEAFSSFDDQLKYTGFIPTGTYFRTIYTEIIDTLQPKMDKHMMLLEGKILKGDHSLNFQSTWPKQNIIVSSPAYTP
ncbi:hypothetical protein BD770DRAFT_73423 [Pilaira anomala]|nr:hypothetical protein BD770DRAFT_73423 [Pilaira anomala]